VSKQPKLLILDPNIQFSRLLTRKLHDVGCNVFVEGDGQKAVSTIEQYRPDWILLELEFKTRTGFDICSEIKRVSEIKNIPILFHTSEATRKNILRSLEVGGSSFIVKPASRETIVRKLNEMSVKLGWEEHFVVDPDKKFGFKSKSTPGADQGEQKQITFSKDMNPQTKIAMLLDNAKEVTAMPFSIIRTMELIQDDKAGAADLGTVIESDIALATKVLARVNTAAYRGQKKIGKVKDAIVRIGFRETRSLILNISIIKNFDQETNSLGFHRGEFWEHSLAVGMIAQNLAESCRMANAELAMTAGLTHDLGKLIFDEYMSSDYECAIEQASKKACSLYHAEYEQFGISHTEVGWALLKKWRFPDELVKVAARHHSQDAIQSDSEQNKTSLVGLIRLADDLACAYQFGNSGDDIIQSVPNQLACNLNLEKGLAPNFRDNINRQLNDLRNFLGIPRGDSAINAHRGLGDKNVILVQPHDVIINTLDFFLAKGWKFEYQCVRAIEELDQEDPTEPRVVILDACNSLVNCEQCASVFSTSTPTTVILLIDDPAQKDQAQAAGWLTESVIVMNKPISGMKLISTIAQIG